MLDSYLVHRAGQWKQVNAHFQPQISPLLQFFKDVVSAIIKSIIRQLQIMMENLENFTS